MPAVIEFGFDSSTVFSGVDKLDRKLRQMDASVSTAQSKLASALRNPWVSAGVDVQKYGAELVRAEKQARLLAAQTAKMAAMKVTGVGYQAATNPWGSAGASQYAAQQAAAKQAADAATMLASQQRAAEAAASAQQKVAAANAATQQKAMAAAAASAAMAAAEQRKAALQSNNGRMNLALIEAQIAGNKREAAGIQSRISLLERMRTIQAQTNVSQREAYVLAQRSAGLPMMMTGGGAGGAKLGIGMAAMQMQDIAVQMQMGTKMSTIVAQQGSQLLSVFGTGGMLLGGIAAVGGMFYTMQSQASEALQTLNNEVGDFDGKLQGLKSKGITDMLQGMDDMKNRADEARAAIGQFSLNRFFSKTTYDSSGKASNAYDVANEAVATTNDQGRLALEKEIVIQAEKQAEIARLRLAGLDSEANKMEENIRLAQMWRQITQRQWATPEGRAAYTKSAEEGILAKRQQREVEAAKKRQEEMERLADSQKSLDERKLQAELEEMDLAKRIATLNVEAQKALEEENRLKSAAKRDDQAIIDAASRTLELSRERNRLQRQYSDEQARQAKEAERESKRRAEEVRQSIKDASQRRTAVTDTALEYKLLQAKAAGRQREIEQAEYQQRVLERAQRLEAQNGLQRREALSLAIKMTDLEDRANGKRRRIRGVQNEDTDPDSRFGLSGRIGPLSNSGPLSRGGPLSKQGGLKGFWDLQMGNSGQLGSGLSGYMLQNLDRPSPSLQATHDANAAAAANGSATSSPAVDTFLEKIITRLPPALAAAILAET